MDKSPARIAEQLASELAAMVLEAREVGLEELAHHLDMAGAEAEKQASLNAPLV